MSPHWNPHPDVRTGRHVVCNLHVHLVFVTKYTRNAFTDAMLTRAEDAWGLRRFRGRAETIRRRTGPRAPARALPQKVQLSKLVNSLNGVSARRLRHEYDSRVRRYLWGGHFWSGSYFAGSCGGGTPDSRQAIHRKPAASRLTVTPEAQSTPALRASGPRTAFTPALKGRALAKIRGRGRQREDGHGGPCGGAARRAGGRRGRGVGRSTGLGVGGGVGGGQRDARRGRCIGRSRLRSWRPCGRSRLRGCGLVRL